MARRLAGTETLLAMMNEETSAHHAELLVVAGTSGVQVDPDPAAVRAFSERLGVPDVFYPDRRIAALGTRDSFGVLNLASRFKRTRSCIISTCTASRTRRWAADIGTRTAIGSPAR